MHIYYFFKDNNCYVMDENHKLYRYQNSNNLELILETENLMTEFMHALKENPFKNGYELNLQDQENINNLF